MSRVDDRFSESLADGRSKQHAGGTRSGSGIEELGGLGFTALVKRMTKASN